MDLIPTVQTLKRLNVGCGSQAVSSKHWINCDLYPGPNVDEVFDIEGVWPFETSTIGEILGNHVLEHLNQPIPFFKEAWRVLIHGGRLGLRLPYGPSSAGLSDITHVKSWTPGMFCFLQPGYGEAVFNPQHNSWKEYFIVESTQLRINRNLRWLCKFPLRQLGAMRILNYLWDAYTEILVSLRAVKEVKVVEKFLEISKGNHIPLSRCMYEHELRGEKKSKPGETVRLINFDLRSTGFDAVEEEKELT